MGAKKGDTLKVHYTGTLEDGMEFDSSKGRDPLEFVLGEGTLIPGFEKAVEGREKGDKITIAIPPEEAYGPVEEGLQVRVERESLPEELDPEVGMVVQLTTDDDVTEVEAIITEVTEEDILLDANHPLAGKKLLFEVEILDIIPV